MADLLVIRGRLGGLPACSCDGTGWMIVTSEGREVARPCAGCSSQRIVRQFGTVAETWESWERRSELEEAVSLLRSWRGGARWACLLHAAPRADNRGAGKSFAAQATAHEWAARGSLVRYVSIPAWCQAGAEAWADGRPPILLPVDFEGLLILDDLGSGGLTPIQRDAFERLGDVRRRYQLPTLVTTNADLAALDVSLPRFTDRLHEGLVIEWQAPSWRRR